MNRQPYTRYRWSRPWIRRVNWSLKWGWWKVHYAEPEPMSHLKDEVYLKRRVLNLQWAGLELWQAWLRVQHRSWVSFQLPLRPATLKTVDDRGSWVLGIRANIEVRIYEHHIHMFKNQKPLNCAPNRGLILGHFQPKERST